MMKKTMRKTVAIMLSVALFIGIFGVMPTATAKTKEQASKKSSRIVEEKTEYSTPKWLMEKIHDHIQLLIKD